MAPLQKGDTATMNFRASALNALSDEPFLDVCVSKRIKTKKKRGDETMADDKSDFSFCCRCATCCVPLTHFNYTRSLESFDATDVEPICAV